MAKKNYILSVVETNSNRAFSTFLGLKRVFILLLMLTGLFILVTFPISSTIQHSMNHKRFENLQRENMQLKKAFSSWHKRMDLVESNLEEIYQKNQHIQRATSYGSNESIYGVGGPLTLSSISLSDLPDAVMTSEKLNKLEADVNWTHRSIKDLEEKLFSRLREINHYPSIRPVKKGWFSSFFGERSDPFTGRKTNHPGLDISLPAGSKVFSSASGIIKLVNHKVIKNKGYGKYVIVEHGFGYETLYGHLSEIKVKKGQKIDRWSVIGLSGDTGKSTAPHLHYGVYAFGKAQNPLYFILD